MVQKFPPPPPPGDLAQAVDCSGIALEQVEGAARVLKRRQPVRVSFAAADGTLQTLEGPVSYLAGDALVQGAHGDRWPVRRAIFDADYSAAGDGLYVKRPRAVLALQMATPFRVAAGHADDVLQGQPGDWLLQYRPGEYGIVKDEIFRATYQPAS